MTAITELLGSHLCAQGNEKTETATALAGKTAVALYFSAHWCPPCKGFTPKLADWYNKDLKAKGLEIVFVSSDQDADAFASYFGEMPWLALPYEDRATKERLDKKFKVQGIPTLVILDSDGSIITKDGRSAVSNDPAGENFPWRPIPPKELLKKATLRSKKGTMSVEQAIEGKKALALYFSAHWCPPCRGFTPQLAEWYKKHLSGKGLEVIFVSSDRDEAAFDEYFGEQPWLALDYGDRKLKEQLSSAFGVSGIPSLVILDSDLNTVTTEGRSALSEDPEGNEMPWHPKPVRNLKSGPGDIQNLPTVIVFCETSTVEEQRSIEQVLTPVAEQYFQKSKESGEEAEFSFMIATEQGGLAGRLRDMLGFEKADPMPPRLALIDIPSDGAYYVAPEATTIGKVEVEGFLADFKSGKLERKQLS